MLTRAVSSARKNQEDFPPENIKTLANKHANEYTGDKCTADERVRPTQRQQAEAHDNLLACHHASDDPPEDVVVTDECHQSLRKFSIAHNIGRNTAIKHRDGLTANMKNINHCVL